MFSFSIWFDDLRIYLLHQGSYRDVYKEKAVVLQCGSVFGKFNFSVILLAVKDKNYYFETSAFHFVAQTNTNTFP